MSQLWEFAAGWNIFHGPHDGWRGDGHVYWVPWTTANGAYGLTRLKREFGTWDLDAILPVTRIRPMRILQPFVTLGQPGPAEILFSALPTANPCDIVVELRRESGGLLAEEWIDPRLEAGLGCDTNTPGWRGEISLPYLIEVSRSMAYVGDVEIFVALHDRTTGTNIELAVQPDGGIAEGEGFYLVGRAKVIDDLGTLTNIALGGTPSASYCAPDDTVLALNDGLLDGSRRHSFRGHVDSDDWVEYAFSTPVTVDAARVLWSIDSDCRLPDSWTIEYQDGGWHRAKLIHVYDLVEDGWNDVTWRSFTTDKIRMRIELPVAYSAGIIEWELYSSAEIGSSRPPQSSCSHQTARTWQELRSDSFESGWGRYSDGGSDCSRTTDGVHAFDGQCAIDLQDNSGLDSSLTPPSPSIYSAPGIRSSRSDSGSRRSISRPARVSRSTTMTGRGGRHWHHSARASISRMANLSMSSCAPKRGRSSSRRT